MQIYENKRKLRKKRVQLPQDLLGTPTCVCFIVLGHQYGGRDVICVEYTQIKRPFSIAYQFD